MTDTNDNPANHSHDDPDDEATVSALMEVVYAVFGRPGEGQ